MVRQLLIGAAALMCVSAYADTHKNAAKVLDINTTKCKTVRATEANRVHALINDGSNTAAKAATASNSVQWKRPAGQFWGTGYAIDEKQLGYYFCPLVLRPWVDYTFENISSVSSTPSWAVQYWDNDAEGYVVAESNEKDVTMSYIRYETPQAPLLSYKNLAYPLMYYGSDRIESEYYEDGYYPIGVLADESISNYWGRGPQAVSSHYWGLFSRNATDRSGIMFYTGADVYDGMDENYGCWFGTNNSGINAMATRFEKPDKPYLLNGVYYYYQFGTDIPKDIPMKAYVFKTENDAEEMETSSGAIVEAVTFGELIAESESFIPAAVSSDDDFQNAVEFKFYEKNPVTGATTEVSLEIEDDITVVVTGFNADLGNGGYLTTFLSADTYDEGYGNLCFLGQLEEGEDGTISYWMPAIKNFFRSALPNTTLGVLADVTYPWIMNYYTNQPTEVQLPNDGETTETVQGLQYALYLMSTSMTEDMEVTYDGEEECDWLSIFDVYDEIEEEDGEEYFTGFVGLGFEATPNPNDETRVSHVKISIPAASYEITFTQGSNSKVNVVVAEGEEQYFDLAGRRVVNPDKGVYIKVNGNKAEKVVL